MSKLDLPAIPRSIMFRSIKEEMAVEWQDFFRKLLVRVGGFDALTNLELAAGSGFGSPTELTIVSGEITVFGDKHWRFHSIDTEGGIASDDLWVINGGNAGELMILQAVNTTRTVICKLFTSLKLQSDFSLDNDRKKIMLMCTSPGVWHEISRAVNN